MIYHFNTKLNSGGSGKYFELLKEIRVDQVFDAIGRITLVNIFSFIFRNLTIVRDESVVKVFHSQITLCLLIMLCRGKTFYIPHGIVNGMHYQWPIRNFLNRIVIRHCSIGIIGCGVEEYENIVKIAGKTRKAQPYLLRNPAIPVRERPELVGERLLFCGPCIRQKGLDRLVELVPSSFQVSVDVVTNEGPFDKFSSNVFESLRRTQLNLIGYQKIDPTFLSNYKALIVCSRFEGLPFLVLEALSMGLHVILPNTPGCREISHIDGVTLYNLDKDSLYEELLLLDNIKPKVDIDLVEKTYSLNEFKQFWENVG